VALLYHRNVQTDEELLHRIENALAANGCCLFIDRNRTFGLDWAKEIENQIRSADVVIPLLSAVSVENEMFAFEVELAHEASPRGAHPSHFIAVRVNFERFLRKEILDKVHPPLVWGIDEIDRLFNYSSTILSERRSLPFSGRGTMNARSIQAGLGMDWSWLLPTRPKHICSSRT